MAYASPAALLLSAAAWLVAYGAAAWAADAHAYPLAAGWLTERLAGTVVDAYLGVAALAGTVRLLLLLQTISLVGMLKGRLSGPGSLGYSLRGKHVVVTGGSQGLGLCIARHCLAQGAKVTLVSRTPSKLAAACDALAAEAPKGTRQVRSEPADLGACTAPEFKELLQRSAEAFGRVDALFANAGFGESKLVIDPDASRNDIAEKDRYLQRMVNINIMGTLRTVTAAADVMAADGMGGRICLVSSAAGLVSTPGYGFYSATKFAHRGFVEGAYEELRHRGVLLSVFYPGTIKTPGFKKEQETIPAVTARIEAQCSDIDTPENCAATLVRGFAAGQREITNEVMFWACTAQPSGNILLDALLHSLLVVIRAGLSLYNEVMVSQYVNAEHDRRRG